MDVIKTFSKLDELIANRNGSKIEQELYQQAFMSENAFIKYNEEFIPFGLIKKKTQQELLDQYGPLVIDLSIDNELSSFFKKHRLKRDFHFISDNISYLIVENALNHNDFFDVKMVQSLCKYQGRTYKATDQTLKAIGQKMGEHVLQTTNYWLEQLPFSNYELEQERYWQVAGSFKQFTWGKLFLPGQSEKKIFLTIGISLREECIFYGLDCLRSGTLKLSTEQILMFDHYTKHRNNLKKIALKDLEGYSWSKLIAETSSFLKEQEGLYFELLDYIWNNTVDISKAEHQLIRVKQDEFYLSKEGMNSGIETQQLAINLVIDFERDTLEYLNKPHLASSIKLLENEEGSNVYDIHSFNSDGSDKYIKVVASTNNSIAGFPLTDTDIERSIEHSDKTYLYSVINLSEERKSGHLIIQKGAFNSLVDLKPVLFTIS